MLTLLRCRVDSDDGHTRQPDQYAVLQQQPALWSILLAEMRQNGTFTDSVWRSLPRVSTPARVQSMRNRKTPRDTLISIKEADAQW